MKRKSKKIQSKKSEKVSVKPKLIIALAIVSVLLLGGLAYYFIKKENYFPRSSEPCYNTSANLELHIPSKGAFSINGLDVSHHQGHIDWQSIAQHKINGYKYHFVFIKATEGRSFVDPKFAYNFAQSKKVGLLRGAYHFYKDDVSAKEQIALFRSVAQLSSGDLAPVLDVEVLDKSNSQKSIENILACMKLLERYYKVKPIFYTYKDLYKCYFKDSPLAKYPLWLAQYALPAYSVPDYSWQIWQYSSKAQLRASCEYFDLNVFRGTKEEFKALLIP